jgi:hypothetical protein
VLPLPRCTKTAGLGRTLAAHAVVLDTPSLSLQLAVTATVDVAVVVVMAIVAIVAIVTISRGRNYFLQRPT